MLELLKSQDISSDLSSDEGEFMVFNNADRTLSTYKGFNITQAAQNLINELSHLGINDLYHKLSGSSFNLSHSAQAPQQLQLSTDKSIYKVGDPVSLTNAKVYDGDGVRNLSRVHFQLKQDGGNWLDIGNATSFTADSHDNHWGNFSFKLPSSSLIGGNYQLSAVAYDKFGATSNNVQISFKVDQAPQNLQFSTDKQSYSNSDVLSLTKAKVYDGDGATDLSRVHFQLKKDGGTWQDINDVTSFTADSQDNHWANFNFTYSLKGLTPGQYQLSAVAYDKSNVASTSVQQSFTVVAAPDWFDQHIQNAALRNEARTDFTRDGMLTRNDMMAIFQKAEAPGVVDATELTDLRTLVSNANYLKLPDYVRVLSNKIVNGDAANAHYQGGTLGNLAAGSSATQLDHLINKWFLGSDRPTTPYTYQYANGSLFQNGISYQDVKQGAVSDCYFLAGLAETAFRSPSTIQNMFTDNGDNTYTVRFYNNGVADYVTVDRYLPTTAGAFAYASMGASSSTNNLWVAFAEKAYAQLDESGWIGHDASNSYQGIGGGWDGYADSQITGGSATYNYLNFNAMVSAFNAGGLMGVNSKVSGAAADIAANHAYAVVGYNSSSQEFTLFNPWGVNGAYENGQLKPGTLQLSWSELTASFDGWTSAIA